MNRQAKSPLLRRLISLLNERNTPTNHYDESRRDFLKSGLVLTAGISAGLTPELLYAANKQPRIAIIGAGLAGLSCAWELRKSGIAASIYEADRRIGGRVQTLNQWPDTNNWVELGGEFINSDHEVVLRLCKELGLSLFDKQAEKPQVELEEWVAVIDQTRYSSSQIKDALKAFMPMVISDYGQLSSGPQAMQQFDAMTLAEYLEGKEIEAWFRQLLHAAFTAEFGLDADSQTCVNCIELLGATNEANTEVFGSSDERYVIQGGNSLLTQTLAQKMEAQIQSGTSLIAITPAASGFQLTFKNRKPTVVDFVVLAVPFSQLSKIDLSKLPLPSVQREAFKEIGYGQNNKLILCFQEAFWSLAPSLATGNAIHDQLHNLWWSNAMQTGRLATLTALMGGSNSLKMAKSLKGIAADSETDLLPALIKEVDYAFPDASNRFNGRWQSALWTNHSLQQGSYVCFKPGQISRFRHVLAKPVGQLFFAGEYTSLKHQGYMNGAAESGMKTAQQLIQQLKSRRKPAVPKAGSR